LTVCGDWYDVAALPDGRIAMAVGDVVGQGLEAAAVMGQLRSALSALTIADVGPANALVALDRYARQQSENATATTCLKVVLDLEQHHATYSCAGHLPPVLLHTSGEIELLNKALGPPLAVTDEAEPRPQATVGFEEGALIVLYTDGLVERRHEDIDEGIGRLIGSLLRHRELDPEPLADALLSDLVDDNTGHDDTALLVIRL
jgi:serine phosphatase RsbU (regulator of sigma subunit)